MKKLLLVIPLILSFTLCIFFIPRNIEKASAVSIEETFSYEYNIPFFPTYRNSNNNDLYSVADKLSLEFIFNGAYEITEVNFVRRYKMSTILPETVERVKLYPDYTLSGSPTPQVIYSYNSSTTYTSFGLTRIIFVNNYTPSTLLSYLSVRYSVYSPSSSTNIPAIFYNICDFSGNIIFSIVYYSNVYVPAVYSYRELYRIDFIYPEEASMSFDLTYQMDSAYDNGYNAGLVSGEASGYARGLQDGQSLDPDTYSFGSLLDSVFYAPLKFLFAIFDFEIFGFNLYPFVAGLIGLAIAVTILRIIFGGF